MTTKVVYKYMNNTDIVYSEIIPENIQYEIYSKLIAGLSKVLVSATGIRRYVVYTQYPKEWQEVDDIWDGIE